jgi:hypothetical protein
VRGVLTAPPLAGRCVGRRGGTGVACAAGAGGGGAGWDSGAGVRAPEVGRAGATARGRLVGILGGAGLVPGVGMFELGERGPGYPLAPLLLLELRGTTGVGTRGVCGVFTLPGALAPGERGPGYPPPVLPELRGTTGVLNAPEPLGTTGVANPLEPPGTAGVASAPELPPIGGVTKLPIGVGTISLAGGSPPATGVPTGIGPFVAPAVTPGPG